MAKYYWQAIYSPITGKNFVTVYTAFDHWNRGKSTIEIRGNIVFLKQKVQELEWTHRWLPKLYRDFAKKIVSHNMILAQNPCKKCSLKPTYLLSNQFNDLRKEENRTSAKFCKK